MFYLTSPTRALYLHCVHTLTDDEFLMPVVEPSLITKAEHHSLAKNGMKLMAAKCAPNSLRQRFKFKVCQLHTRLTSGEVGHINVRPYPIWNQIYWHPDTSFRACLCMFQNNKLTIKGEGGEMLCASGNSFLDPPDCIFFQPCQANATHQEWHRHEKYPDLFALVHLSYFPIGLCGAENISKKSRFCSFPYTFETRISCISIPTISGDCALLPRSSTHPPASPIQVSA